MNLSHSELSHHGQQVTEKNVNVFARINKILQRMSLAKRMFILSTLILFAFLSGAALMLRTVFSISLESIVQEKLSLHTYQMLSTADSNAGMMRLPTRLNEPRFNQPQGALIAFVKELTQDNQQREVWRSMSANDKQFSFPAPSSGQWFFGRARGSDGAQYYVSSYTTTWTSDSGVKAKYVFTVMEDFSYYQTELSKYRTVIAAGLFIFALVFLSLQTLILHVGLRPVRKITSDVDDMNKGESRSLVGQYPRELMPLTTNLNRLIDNERLQRERYRERMADLSHGLKTPLSVLQGLGTDIDEQGLPISRSHLLQILSNQVSRMTKLVDYQLQRAIPNGSPTVFAKIEVASKAIEVISALDKVYASKAITSKLDIEEGLFFYGDESDLIEMIGNVLDNAFKHAQSSVSFTACRVFIDTEDPKISFTVEDDGKGVPVSKREAILRRGVQLDTHGEGQGFGLSIVADIVSSYEGQLTIRDSSLGGALFQITVPTR
ncbi:two-component system sensor histidine kinase PhoQ [Arenicella sp. 4NH20-0111]|uniref:ATP-binding protein n=1 Tax=Arenicella sp. 4NH20-0111 TaxID=3127648 RepID=UPI0031021668